MTPGRLGVITSDKHLCGLLFTATARRFPAERGKVRLQTSCRVGRLLQTLPFFRLARSKQDSLNHGHSAPFATRCITGTHL